MNRRRMVVISLAVVAAMAALSGWAWFELPDGAQVPTHWNIAGQVDGWADKSIGLAALPVVALGLTALFAVLPSIEPRRGNLERSWRGYRAIWASILVLFFGLHLAVVAVGLDQSVDISRLMVIASGLLLIVIGNYLPTMRSNWFVGIRTPWTLASERSWELTHRMGGRLFVLVGILALVVGAFDVGGSMSFAVIVGGIAAVTVAVLAYSYVVWRSDPTRRESSGR